MVKSQKILASTIFVIGIILSMGFLNKLLAKLPPKKQFDVIKITESHKEDWASYFSNVDNKLGSIFVDLGLKNIAPIHEKPNVVWVSIKMNSPREDGLSSSEESHLLWEIEDKIVDKLTSNGHSIYVGRLTSDGRRDLYFYASDPIDVNKPISDIAALYPSYKFYGSSKSDPDWEGYFDFLYPSPQNMQCIQNGHVVDNLEKHGDSLTKSRLVNHWLYFKTEQDRVGFLTKITPDGFTIVNQDFDKKLGALPYQLQIERVDKVDLNSVNDYTIHLWKLAQEFNGEYDGWETQVQ